MGGNGSADRARRDYTRLARAYDRIWSRYLERSIAITLDGLALADHRRVLDVGCGTGLLLARLARGAPGLELVGLDATPAMLDRARARLGDDATLVVGEAGHLPFAEREFDLVLSTSMLHELASPAAAVAEWARVLAPRGTLAVTDWRADHGGTRAHLAALRLMGRHAHPLSARELLEAVRAADLRPTRARTFQAQGWGLTAIRGIRSQG